MIKQIREVQILTSLEVAEMMEKEHSKLIRDIRRYNEQLSQAKIGSSDFWLESTYKTERGKEYPCYNITKKGCEFIAHKMTGVKGTAFTAKYINRFHEMEDALLSAVPEAGNPALLELITKQTELLEKLTARMERIEQKAETDAAGHLLPGDAEIAVPVKTTGIAERSYLSPDIVAMRAKELAKQVKKIAKLTGYDKNIIFRAMYLTVEENFNVSLDSYLEVARHEYKEDACTLHVVAMWDEFYDFALEINRNEIDNRSVYRREGAK